MAAHEMKIHIIKTISKGTKDLIIKRTKNKDLAEKLSNYNAVGLIHGDVCDMIYAGDLAQKTSAVYVFEIPGSCPQHMTCIGILGDVSAVEAAIGRIRQELI